MDIPNDFSTLQNLSFDPLICCTLTALEKTKNEKTSATALFSKIDGKECVVIVKRKSSKIKLHINFSCSHDCTVRIGEKKGINVKKGELQEINDEIPISIQVRDVIYELPVYVKESQNNEGSTKIQLLAQGAKFLRHNFYPQLEQQVAYIDS